MVIEIQNEKRMNWLETNSTFPLPPVDQPAQPWLNTEARLPLNYHLPTVQNLSPLTAPIQVGTLSVSPITVAELFPTLYSIIPKINCYDAHQGVKFSMW